MRVRVDGGGVGYARYAWRQDFLLRQLDSPADFYHYKKYGMCLPATLRVRVIVHASAADIYRKLVLLIFE